MKHCHFKVIIELLQSGVNRPLSVDNILKLLLGLVSLKPDTARQFAMDYPSLQEEADNINVFQKWHVNKQVNEPVIDLWVVAKLAEEKNPRFQQ